MTFELLKYTIALMVPNSDTPILLYNIRVDPVKSKKLKISKLPPITTSTLAQKDGDVVTSFDGYTLPSRKTVIFVTMSYSQFSIVFIDNRKKKYDVILNNELSDFYHERFSDELIYTGIKVISAEETEDGYSFVVICTTKHALGFRVAIDTDSSG